ncbi:hypothetical protein [Humisphaera borealis]|uniref:Uncharacterized protein n=1 Tax=Humisphaera borealis TaxID=2807512 RepID=A0A7M2X1A9_9BACT|nr:hypothetical protein [Humisphaera borealis]QOV91454.1 hypothetical protein IPV69_08895 [Humisphaera borealis]
MNNVPETVEATPEEIAPQLRRRHGAVGKAIIVWLVTGSALAGLGAYLLFGSMGC